MCGRRAPSMYSHRRKGMCGLSELRRTDYTEIFCSVSKHDFIAYIKFDSDTSNALVWIMSGCDPFTLYYYDPITF